MKKLFLILNLFLVAGMKAEDSQDLEFMQQFTDALDYGRFDKFEAIYKQHPEWVIKNKEELTRKINLQFEAANNLEQAVNEKLQLQYVSVSDWIWTFTGLGLFISGPAIVLVELIDVIKKTKQHYQNNSTVSFYKNQELMSCIYRTLAGSAAVYMGVKILDWVNKKEPTEKERPEIEKAKNGLIAVLKLIQVKKSNLSTMLTLIDPAVLDESKKE